MDIGLPHALAEEVSSDINRANILRALHQIKVEAERRSSH
jgi:hypothetical protein